MELDKMTAPLENKPTWNDMEHGIVLMWHPHTVLKPKRVTFFKPSKEDTIRQRKLQRKYLKETLVEVDDEIIYRRSKIRELTAVRRRLQAMQLKVLERPMPNQNKIVDQTKGPGNMANMENVKLE